MKIALVVPGGVDRSGRERVIPALLSLIARLAQRHQLFVYALRQYDQACRYPLLGATVTNLGQPQRGRAVPGRTLLWRKRALVRALRADGPFDVVHAFWAALPGWLAATAAGELGIPSLVSLAGGELAALPDISYGGQLHWQSRLLTARALRQASCVTAASSFMAAAAASRGVATRIVPLGAEPCAGGTVAAPSQRPQVEPYRLLHVASLNRVKDPWTLLGVMRRVVDEEPRVHLDIVGGDTLGGAVQRRSSELGLDAHVTFHGQRPSAELATYYQAADLFVLTSRHEAGPLVVLEAAACGLPTVGTAVGHLADWAGSLAHVVPVGDVTALADGVLRWLRDAPGRTALGAAAQAWSRAHDADHTAASFEALYAELRASPAAAGAVGASR